MIVEVLIKVGDRSSRPTDWKDGDIIAVKPAGWDWGPGDESSHYALVAEVPEDIAKGLDQTVYDAQGKLVRRRDFKVPLAKLGLTPAELARIRDPKVRVPINRAKVHAAGVIERKNA